MNSLVQAADVQMMFSELIVNNNWGTTAGERVFVETCERSGEGYCVIEYLPVCWHAP